MKKSTKIIIPIAVAVIIIAAIICVLSIPKSGETTSVTAMLSTAQKYLIDLDYEQAIAEFEKIIELEPRNVDAYLGLAEAYEKSGDIDKAIEILQQGYELTADEQIAAALEVLLGQGEEETETTTTTTPTTTTTVTTTTPTTTTPTTTTPATTTTVATTTQATTTEAVEEFITIKGEKYSTNLTRLWLDSRELTNEDIEPLSRMTNLTYLILSGNNISDISALSNLTNLTNLHLGHNDISDISALSNLTNLTYLGLNYNNISDISALSNLTNLTS
ncbi:MAG: leucine-rich repeat domain-containing protein, partial [Oscillospiraceae bacterium]|nr:leucine-rich repeat domain-containing protein [Oscillospiraceae bacterium]